MNDLHEELFGVNDTKKEKRSYLKPKKLLPILFAFVSIGILTLVMYLTIPTIMKQNAFVAHITTQEKSSRINTPPKDKWELLRRKFMEEYDWVDYFSEGLVLVKDYKGVEHYLDENGNRIISNVRSANWAYEHGVNSSFHDGLALISVPSEVSYIDYFTYINKNGEQVPKDTVYQRAKVFSCGLAPVMMDDHTWCYINTSGEQAFPGQFKEAHPFYAEVAPVADEKGQYYLIDTKGKRVSDKTYEYLSLFYGDVAEAVTFEKGEPRLGLINSKEEIHFPTNYNSYRLYFLTPIPVEIEGKTYYTDTDRSIFLEEPAILVDAGRQGMALADSRGRLLTEFRLGTISGRYYYGMVVEGGGYKKSVVDWKGNVILDYDWIFIDDLNEFTNADKPLFSVKSKEQKSIFDNNGKLLFNYDGIEIYPASDTLLCLKVDEYQFALVDKRGKFITDPIFQEHFYFSSTDNLAAVSLGYQEWGYIGPDGKMKIPARFQEALSFNKGLAAVKEEGKWGWIDTKGNYVIKPKYENIGQFQGNKAIALLDGKYGYIDRDDNVIIPFEYDWLGDFNKYQIGVAYKGGKCGLINEKNEVIVDFQYQSAEEIYVTNEWTREYYYSGVVKFRSGDDYYYYSPQGKKLN